MADKKISDLTAVTSIATGDLFETETATGGNSRNVTATNLGKGLRSAAFQGVSVYRSSDLTISVANTPEDVSFDSEHFDTDGFHSTVSNTSRITMSGSGYCELTGFFRRDTNTTTYSIVFVKQYNSSNTQLRVWRAMTATSTSAVWLTVPTGPVAFSSGDYFTMAVQSGTTTGALNSGTDGCRFTMNVIG
jgi:hypothetical protein